MESTQFCKCFYSWVLIYSQWKKSLCMKVENVNSRLFRKKNPYIGDKWETVRKIRVEKKTEVEFISFHILGNKKKCKHWMIRTLIPLSSPYI